MNILLIEDDPVTLAACETFLGRLGHEVTCMDDGDRAWRLLESERFPVIICDWSLPGKSGVELCAQIRTRKTPEYPYFILITSFQGHEKMTEAMEAGVDDFLPKPIDLPILASRLRVAQRILDFNLQIGILTRLVPICMYCKNIRNDQEYWQTVESYFTARVGADFTHSLCPDCYQRHVLPELKRIGGTPAP